MSARRGDSLGQSPNTVDPEPLRRAIVAPARSSMSLYASSSGYIPNTVASKWLAWRSAMARHVEKSSPSRKTAVGGAIRAPAA